MSGTEQQLFMQVKQKLDYYRLPTIFPAQATNLLHKMLRLIEKYRKQGQQNNVNSSNSEKGQNIVEGAIRREMGKVIQENNKIHMELINAKEEIQSLKHCLDKVAIEKSNGNKEIQTILMMKNIREKELFEELGRVKYRYNELMDMIHEDPNVEKQYIKRLLKHKKYQQDQERQFTKATKEKKPKLNQENITKLQFLQNKIQNRQAEILRLQNRLQYDGLNMNKVIKEFQQDVNRSKISSLNQQIEYLEGQNTKMKQQVAKCRNNGGSKEALREQVRKNHEQIKRLDSQNKNMKKKLKQSNFDNEVNMKQSKREVKKVNDKLIQQTHIKADMENVIKNLEKKVQFYSKEADSMKKQIKNYQNQLVQKQVAIQELKNATAGDKILEKYQIENLRRKIQETQDNNHEIIRQNKRLLAENLFYKEQGGLKSQAIQNLQNIVDQLRIRNNQAISSFNEEQLMIHQKAQTDYNRLIVQQRIQKDHAHNKLIQMESEIQRAKIQIQRLNRDKIGLINQNNRLKTRILDEKKNQEICFVLKKQAQDAKNNLRRQQSNRLKMEVLLKQNDIQKEQLRKQVIGITNNTKDTQKKMKKIISELEIKVGELQQTIMILEVRLKEKEGRIIFYERKIEQLQQKMKNMMDQIALIQDQNHKIMKQKHRVEKRYDEVIRQRDGERQRQIQVISLNQNEHATQVVWLKREIKTLTDNNAKYLEKHKQFSDLINILKRQKDQLNLDKINFMKENDHLRLRLQDLERMLALR